MLRHSQENLKSRSHVCPKHAPPWLRIRRHGTRVACGMANCSSADMKRATGQRIACMRHTSEEDDFEVKHQQQQMHETTEEDGKGLVSRQREVGLVGAERRRSLPSPTSHRESLLCTRQGPVALSGVGRG